MRVLLHSIVKLLIYLPNELFESSRRIRKPFLPHIVHNLCELNSHFTLKAYRVVLIHLVLPNCFLLILPNEVVEKVGCVGKGLKCRVHVT